MAIYDDTDDVIRDDGVMPSVGQPAQLPAIPDSGYRGDDDDASDVHELDSPRVQRILTRAREWFETEWERQAHNRFQMALDENFYDGLQIEEQVAAEMVERGQPPTVYNEVKATIDWMIGTERRTRIDYKVLPREDTDTAGAKAKTEFLKYLSDVNNEPMARSQAAENQLKAGLGWIEVCVGSDPTSELIQYRFQNWRQMLYDSSGVELDLRDGRYVFRWKWIDCDIAKAYFPEREKQIEQSETGENSLTGAEEDEDIWYLGARVTAPNEDWSNPSRYAPYSAGVFAQTRRNRVKLIECWYRDFERAQLIVGGTFAGEDYVPGSPHDIDVQSGRSGLIPYVKKKVKCIVFCEGGALWEGDSPYRHGRFPFVPVWGYRRAADNAPYGPIRNMRDPQDAFNKRMSKAVWLLSTNQIIAEKGAVEDKEEMREEAARPDGYLEHKKGHAFEIRRESQLAEQHVRMAERDQMMIRATGGVTAENLGRETNANSGRAIIARQDQGGVVTTELYDNQRFAAKLAGEIELALVEQFETREKVIRIIGERGNAKFIKVNERKPDGSIINPITQTKADFIVSEQDYRDSLRIAMFESLMDITGRLAQMSPEVALKLLDVVFDMADIPNRDVIVARIRQINGMRDPDVDPTPEERKKMEEADREAAQQKQLAQASVLLELAKLKKEVAGLDADAAKTRLEGILKAIEAAQLVSMDPRIGPIADDLMRGAGQEDQTDNMDSMDQMRDQMAAQQQQAAQQAAQQQAPGLPQPQQLEPPQ